MKADNLTIFLKKACEDKDKDSVFEIIKIFDPLLNKYAMQLNYDCAKTDLIIFLIEFIGNINYKKISLYTEGQIVNYIFHSLSNKKIDIFRKESLHSCKLTNIENFQFSEKELSIESNLALYDAISLLPVRQQQVIIGKFVYGYSDEELGTYLKVTRQAINRLKLRAFKFLRAQLLDY